MDVIGSSLRTDILQANITMFKTIGIGQTALENGYVPLDIDVTQFDNSKTFKESVSRTYKGFDGYAPIMAYLGMEGFLVKTELREGKQHSQKGTPAFLRQSLALARQLTAKSLLVRMDSGNDAAENLGILIEDGSWFVIKRNLRASEKKRTGSKKSRNAVKMSAIHAMARRCMSAAAGKMFLIKLAAEKKRPSACGSSTRSSSARLTSTASSCSRLTSRSIHCGRTLAVLTTK